MRAEEVITVLEKRWPLGQHAHLREVSLDPMGGGRRCDLLVIGLWSSRGHEVDAVEVKVSVDDARTEFRNAAKAQGWWEHSNRFWIAAPADVARKIKDELPPTWGMISVSDGSSRVLVQAERRERKPFTWGGTIGLLRAAGASSTSALERIRRLADQAGYARGIEDGRAQTAGNFYKDRAEALERAIDAFRDKTGIDITWDQGAAVMFRAAHAARKDAYRITNAAASLRQLAAIADVLEALVADPQPSESPQ